MSAGIDYLCLSSATSVDANIAKNDEILKRSQTCQSIDTKSSHTAPPAFEKTHLFSPGFVGSC